MSDGAPIEDEPKPADIGKDSFLPQLKGNLVNDLVVFLWNPQVNFQNISANVEGNFAKFMEKTAEDAFLNLKLYRIKTSDSDKSNIMKIFSPRKQNKFSVSVKWPKNELTTPSDIADLVKMDATTPSNDVEGNVQKIDDFQDVSLVHDPMNLGVELTNDIENFETSTNLPWTDATTESYLQSTESEEFVTTGQTLDEDSKTTTETRVSMVNPEDLSESKDEPSTSLPTETPVTETATDELKTDEKDESSTQGSTTEKEQITTESSENSEPNLTTEEPHQETSTQEMSTISAEPKENSVPEEIHVQITPTDWLAVETDDSSKEKSEEAATGSTEEPIQENVSPKITAPIKRSANPKESVEPPKRGFFHLFPNAVTTTRKEMHGKPLKESTGKHSTVNQQQTTTTERPLPSEKPTIATTVSAIIIETTEKEQKVALSMEGSTTDAPPSEVKIEENDRTTETMNVNQNVDESKGEMVGISLDKSEIQATTQQTNVHQAPESVNTQAPETTSSKILNAELELTTVGAEISKPTESSSPKDPVVASVQDQVVATITEENSSPVTELPLSAPATTIEITTVSTFESTPLTTVDSSPKMEAITTTTEISSTQTITQTPSVPTTVKPTIKPTAKTSGKKPEAPKSNAELLMSSFPNSNPNSATHPLLSRIMLTAPLRPMQMPIFMQRNVNRNVNRNPNPLLGIASPVFRRRKHVKRSAARIDDEDNVFVSPKPFGRLPSSPGEQMLGPTQRPTLLQRYRDMDSVEKAETKKVVVEKIMHGVNIAGHIDGYITNTVKSGVAALHRALNGRK